ncbi:hypothetical protein BWZ20_05110 [Winogradskyella sp. J14-2]|nr:hypothetical protein BWZ20_05110 [Winogradskyella sp. J14-2]
MINPLRVLIDYYSNNRQFEFFLQERVLQSHPKELLRTRFFIIKFDSRYNFSSFHSEKPLELTNFIKNAKQV